VEFYTAMINSSLLNLDHFDNSDPHILTILLIGTEDHIKTYIHQQHRPAAPPQLSWKSHESFA
jgi:hypothetical protein